MAKYDFRKDITVNHGKIITKNQKASSNELAFPSNFTIKINGGSVVTKTAVEDFMDFLSVAFDVTATVGENEFLSLNVDTSLDAEKIDYKIKVSNKIEIFGSSDRSLAQALYYLEFCLKERAFFSVKVGEIHNKMPYSPRIIHSGYGLDEYPNEYLSTIAHYGYDAIAVFVKGVDETTLGYLDFNDLCNRAEKYGIDVYAYSYISNFTNPKEKGSKELYEELYGGIFKNCPKMKGMIFVGESVEFLSEDEHVVKHRYNEYSTEGIPENKPSPGWWPCRDYADWISLVRDSIRKHKKDADIVFWTYNWGWVNEEDRVKLLKSLPTDISLLVTFEMFEKYKIFGIEEKVSDYSLTNPYAGKYFISEAKIAKERNIKLYSMTNTAGRTWDMGTVPYLPMPYQWIERFKSVNDAQKNYSLCGLMEGHHYGFYPSFISRLATLSFINVDYENNLERVLKVEYGFVNETLLEGLKYLSESIKYFPPTIEEQYGPMRVGTNFPLCLIKGMQPVEEKGVHFGNNIWSPLYGQFDSGLCLGYGDNGTPYAVREKAEIKMLKKAKELIEKSISLFKKCETEKIAELINLSNYIKCSVITEINVKEFYHNKIKLKIGSSKFVLKKAIKNIKEIAKKEQENAKESIEYLEKDSRLGFEPSMLYANSKERVEWKIEQIDYMLKNELSFYEDNIIE